MMILIRILFALIFRFFKTINSIYLDQMIFRFFVSHFLSNDKKFKW